MQTLHTLGHPLGPWHRVIPLAILAVAVAALSTAFIAEHVYGLEPCILCLYQRIPYAVAGLVAAATLVVPTRWKPWMLGGCAIILLFGSALALYHVGVEQHWWDSIASCGGAGATPATIDELRAELRKPTTFRPCDRVDWTLFGLSLAAYNGMGSALFAAATMMGAWMVWREARG